MIDSVSLRPTKKTQLALETNLLSQEKQNSPSKGRDNKFYCLSEGERAHLLSNRETFKFGFGYLIDIVECEFHIKYILVWYRHYNLKGVSSVIRLVILDKKWANASLKKNIQHFVQFPKLIRENVPLLKLDFLKIEL